MPRPTSCVVCSRRFLTAKDGPNWADWSPASECRVACWECFSNLKRQAHAVREALAFDWGNASIVHTGGNVFALAIWLAPDRECLIGWPQDGVTVGITVQDPDTGETFGGDEIGDASIQSTDGSSVARFVTRELGKLGYRPSNAKECFYEPSGGLLAEGWYVPADETSDGERHGPFPSWEAAQEDE